MFIFWYTMFHYLKGKIQQEGNFLFLVNEVLWVQIQYAWKRSEGGFFLFPQYEEQRKTVNYFAFDTSEQKYFFEELLKINGIGAKTAFLISQLNKKELNDAIKKMDTAFFQAIPWIGPKSAKKIVLELKGNINLEEVSQMNLNQKLFKDIVKTLKGLGYETEVVKEKLLKYHEPLTKENMSEVIKWLISQM